MNRINAVSEAAKNVAEAGKKMAETVSTIKEATAAPAPETVIVDRIHTSDTLVVLKEQTAYVPFAVELEAPTFTGSSGPAALAAPGAAASRTPDEYEQDQTAKRSKARPLTREAWLFNCFACLLT